MEPISTTAFLWVACVGLATAKPDWRLYELNKRRKREFPELQYVLSSAGVTELKEYGRGQSNLPSMQQRVLSELDRYASLPENWDGNGSARISPEIIAEAKLFLQRYPGFLPVPTPTIDTEGQLSLYLDSESGYLEFAFEGNKEASLYIHDRITKKDRFVSIPDWTELDGHRIVTEFSVVVPQLPLAA